MQRTLPYSQMGGVFTLGNESLCSSQAKLARTVAALIPTGMRVDAARQRPPNL